MTSPFAKKPASVKALKKEKPALAAPSENFAKEELVGMTFNVPKSWHTEFKIVASQRRGSMHDLLFEIYDFWKNNDGKSTIRNRAPDLPGDAE